jgi:hypothetical protein
VHDVEGCAAKRCCLGRGFLCTTWRSACRPQRLTTRSRTVATRRKREATAGEQRAHGPRSGWSSIGRRAVPRAGPFLQVDALEKRPARDGGPRSA